MANKPARKTVHFSWCSHFGTLAFALSAAFALGACATGRVEIRTVPEGAEAYVVRADNSTLLLGKTPLTLSPESSPELQRDIITLQLKRDGYQHETVIIPNFRAPVNTQVSLSMKEGQAGAQARTTDATINEVARGVLSAQRLVGKKTLGEAKTTLQELIRKYPRVGVLHDLLGNVYYLEKDTAHALESYRRSLEIEPENRETARVIEKLGKIQTGRD
jgi:tetratricopeptide (TPR) repeat protein